MSKSVQTLTAEQCERFLIELLPAGCGGYGNREHTRNYTMALLMLDAGLRVGEVVGLTRGCLMFADHFCDVVAIPDNLSHNKVGRKVPLTQRLKDTVQEMNNLYWKPDGVELIGHAFYRTFPSCGISARQVQRIIKYAAIDSIGIAITPHTLRHTFATRLMEKVSLRIVQELLGHKSIQSTQVYTHPNSEHLKSAIESL